MSPVAREGLHHLTQLTECRSDVGAILVDPLQGLTGFGYRSFDVGPFRYGAKSVSPSHSMSFRSVSERGI